MVIELGYDNKVRRMYIPKENEDVKVDNIKTFEVETFPDVDENTALYFNPETKEFYTKPRRKVKPVSDEVKVRLEAQEQKANALKWLSDNDWKVNKRALGEWAEDDERWIAYLEGRAKARAAIDEADAVLNG